MPPNQDKISYGKHIEQYRRPQLLCVLLVQRIYAIDLAHDATVGNRSIILKFSYVHQDASMEYTSNEGKGVHLHTLVDRERKRSRNGDDVVEHDVIQITDDLSTERTVPPRSTHYGTATSPPS